MVILDPPEITFNLLRQALMGVTTTEENEEWTEVLVYVSFIASSLASSQDFDPKSWTNMLYPYFSSILYSSPSSSFYLNGGNSVGMAPSLQSTIENFRSLVADVTINIDPNNSTEEGKVEDDELLANVEFSLAYGSKILLHRTQLHLRRGHKYGLVGDNGVGKTTLMRAIYKGKLEGWPDNLTTCYVDSGFHQDFDPISTRRTVLLELVYRTNFQASDCRNMLDSLGFSDELMNKKSQELSGGWLMKMKLAHGVMVNTDLMLLDEPTNHLDQSSVKWLISYLQNLNDRTIICVSHDTRFLDALCTDVINFEFRPSLGPHCKLVHYKCRMSEFVKKLAHNDHFFSLSSIGKWRFIFPQPGRLDGVKTSTQRFLEMNHVQFTYPGNNEPTLSYVNVTMSLSSRVVLLGGNGAGKTTLVKMIVGETQPSNIDGSGGRMYIHHNLQVAYVSQHAFYHIERHLDESPVSYMQWRFKDGYDREKFLSDAYRIGPDEKLALHNFGIEGVWSRRLRGGVLEYEIKKKNIPEKDNKYYSREQLLHLGFEKLLKQSDAKIAAKEAGIDVRPITTSELQLHFDNFGLIQEYGTYGKIRGLSGGQKVKLVLAAAMWNCPHLLIMDEPTNYLDREALGALSAALNEWEGSVLMISHQKEFYSSICNEEWLVENGTVMIQGSSVERNIKSMLKKKTKNKRNNDDLGDELLQTAGGNVNSNSNKYFSSRTNFWGKMVSKKDLRSYDKAKKKGDVKTMRKILQIPIGKVMPGYEDLADGNI